MGKKVIRFFTKPIFPYLYGLWFLVYKSFYYLPSFSFVYFITGLVVYISISYILIYLFTKSLNKAAASWCSLLIWVSLLHITTISKLFGFSPNYISNVFVIAIYFLLALTISMIVVKKNKNWLIKLEEFNLPINVFFFFFIVIIISNEALQNKNVAARKIKQHEDVTFKRKPNILWLLLDEYGSSSVLLKGLQYRNALDDLLISKGFVVLPRIETTQASTLYSVNCIMNDYPDVKLVNFYQAIDLLRDAHLVEDFEKQGYAFENISYFDINRHKKKFNQSGYPQDYFDQIISGTIFSYVINEVKFTSKKSDFFTQSLMQQLYREISTTEQKPKFIWAHFMMPHEPFTRDSLGAYHQSEKNFNRISDSASIRKQYIDYLSYANRFIKQLLDKYPQLSEYLIVISGDHGPRYEFLKKMRAENHPYAAIYVPQKKCDFDTMGISFISEMPGRIKQYLSIPN